MFRHWILGVVIVLGLSLAASTASAQMGGVGGGGTTPTTIILNYTIFDFDFDRDNRLTYSELNALRTFKATQEGVHVDRRGNTIIVNVIIPSQLRVRGGGR